MNLPSKELLSEVLSKPLRNFNMYIERNELVYDRLFHEGCTDGYAESINLYELAYRCKEWAIEQGFSITSTNSYMGDLQPTAQLVSSNGCEYPWINGVTEPEAIFKVCQGILDNKETK